MKSLTKPSAIRWLTLSGFIVFSFISCQKETTTRRRQNQEAQVVGAINKESAKNIKRVNVANISQLYEAVNHPANAGSLLVLAAGEYILDASYPNAGRLELLENMQLQGQPGHPESVIIDASLLPGTSFNPPFNFPAARTGAIRMGKGNNSIEWLTVKGNATSQALSVIDTDLIGVGESNITIAHCFVTGGRIGIDIRNVGVASKNRVINATLMNNEVVENVVQQGQGIEIQNANGASGAVIRAVLNGNYIHGNKVGLRSFNNNANNIKTDSGSITIQSNADRFEENGIGIFLVAGLNQGTSTSANNNTVSFEAHGSSIKNNNGTIPPDVSDVAPGGMYVAGGLSANIGDASSNTLQIILSGCTLSNNKGPDIKAYGYLSIPIVLYGTNNATTINLTGVSAKSIVTAIASIPNEPGRTNTINVYH